MCVLVCWVVWDNRHRCAPPKLRAILRQDSHVHLSLGGNRALYAVFDGHGGAQVRTLAHHPNIVPSARPTAPLLPTLGVTKVAQFCQRHIAELVTGSELFPTELTGNYGPALTEGFRR